MSSAYVMTLILNLKMKSEWCKHALSRRFVIDERRERYYRVEVQNKVYRRELVALDAEINKLERMLIEPPPSPSSSGSESNRSVSLPGSFRVSVVKIFPRLRSYLFCMLSIFTRIDFYWWNFITFNASWRVVCGTTKP